MGVLSYNGMMSKKNLMPEGTTMRQVREAFHALAESDDDAIAREAKDVELTIEQIGSAESMDEPMDLEELWGFRDTFIRLMNRKED